MGHMYRLETQKKLQEIKKSLLGAIVFGKFIDFSKKSKKDIIEFDRNNVSLIKDHIMLSGLEVCLLLIINLINIYVKSIIINLIIIIIIIPLTFNLLVLKHRIDNPKEKSGSELV